MIFDFDVIVIGAGHAGCEAARAAALLGSRTLLVTMDMNKIAQMSCNPAVGGIAKGQIVREIDALGGGMGVITDSSTIQFRMLNRSKGPAMWSPRAQADRMAFSLNWRSELENTRNLYMWQDSATGFVVEKGVIKGVKTALGVTFSAKAVVLTAGTFLNGLMHVGRVQWGGGRIAEPLSTGLTEQLRELGFQSDRMKTGTPVRLDARTIDFSLTDRQDGDSDGGKFSYLPESGSKLPQLPCFSVRTNEETHEILRSGLPDSPLYNGQIQSIGPRYCPSIETKIVTFADKNEHHLFLEPEGATTTEYYLNGFSSSLPFDVQMRALQTIPALRNVQIYRPGYAIEYDFFQPTQLCHTLETRPVRGLFFAGQVNGTTGYEEAGGQGLIAGINADAYVHGKDPLVLGRDESYIGVLIDDLVNKGVDEPYRMFTSRAEYRILLRQDDADMRLTPRGYEIGLVTQSRYDAMERKRQERDALIEWCSGFTVKMGDKINEALEGLGTSPMTSSLRLVELLKRPQLNFSNLANIIGRLRKRIGEIEECRREEIVESAEILIKYDGYIARERELAAKAERLEYVKLPIDMDYFSLLSLSAEARQKLSKIRPVTIGQASRIPGVSPADINILLVLLKR